MMLLPKWVYLDTIGLPGLGPTDTSMALDDYTRFDVLQERRSISATHRPDT